MERVRRFKNLEILKKKSTYIYILTQTMAEGLALICGAKGAILAIALAFGKSQNPSRG
jgi:hypothetical protein